MHNLCFESKNVTKNGTLVNYEAKGELIIGKKKGFGFRHNMLG
jgi:hypothetical protein